MRQIALLKPLRHYPFRLLFFGQVISDLGDWLDYLAIITLIVYQWQLGAIALAVYTIATFLPMVLVGPFAGVWVDRWSHRTTMIACDLGRAVLVLGLVWVPNMYVLLLIVSLNVTFNTFFNPARQALIRFTVPNEDLLPANSLSQLSMQVTKIIGPAVGGVLVLIGGTHAAFVVDALSFLVSALILSQLPRTISVTSSPHTHEKHHFWQEFRTGFTYIFQSRVLMVTISSMAAALFIIFTFDSLLALAFQSLGFSPSLLGLGVGSVGLGTAVGAVIIGQWGKQASSLKLMASGNVLIGLMVAFMGSAVLLHITIAFAIWFLIWLFIGLGVSAIFVPYGYILQKETLPQLMGRVSSAANSLQTTFQLLAPLIGALIANSLGVGTLFSASGILLALLGTILLSIRFKSDPPQPDSGTEKTQISRERDNVTQC
jgi:MFS family permease